MFDTARLKVDERKEDPAKFRECSGDHRDAITFTGRNSNPVLEDSSGSKSTISEAMIRP